FRPFVRLSAIDYTTAACSAPALPGGATLTVCLHGHCPVPAAGRAYTLSESTEESCMNSRLTSALTGCLMVLPLLHLAAQTDSKPADAGATAGAAPVAPAPSTLPQLLSPAPGEHIEQ